MEDIKVFKTLNSTNKYLKEELLAGGIFRDFLGILALEQSGGVGKNSKAWFSPMGNLYISFVVDSGLCEEQDLNSNLAEVVFKSVIATGKTLDFVLQEKSVNLQYKWPNDVMYDGKKIAGILIEKIKNKYIIGMGLNLNVSPQIKDYATIAVCDIINNINDGFCVLDIAKRLRAELKAVFGFGFQQVRESFLDRAYKLHKTIRISVNNRVLEGRFVDIDIKHGALVLQEKDGKMQNVHYGEIF